jgi:D-glycero-D-manno-heptose 1,7-bisphosphate phosphatase
MVVKQVKRRAVFLDRDGTLNIDKGFVYRREDFEFINGAVDALVHLKEKGFLLVVITNQSGIGRGLYTEKEVHALHNYINDELRTFGTSIDRFYFCPHHPEAPIAKYRKNCECRKPKPGMIMRALIDLGIDPETSYVIGNKVRDISAGQRAGITSILIGEDENTKDSTDCGKEPDLVVKSLFDAAQYVLSKT